MPTAKQATTTPEDVYVPQSLGEALLVLQGNLPVVRRATEGQVGPRTYKYADLGDIMSAVQPVLTRCGLVYLVQPRQALRGDHYEIVGVLLHTSTDAHIEASLPLTGGIGPQQMGAALTYARRYLLACLTGLITDEDPDGRGTTDEVVRGTQPPPAVSSREPDELLEAQETVAANWKAGGHGDFDIHVAAQIWQGWGQVAGAIHEASPAELLAFAKWLVTEGHANRVVNKEGTA